MRSTNPSPRLKRVLIPVDPLIPLDPTVCPSEKGMTNMTTTATVAADTIDLRTASVERITELLMECLRVDQDSYFGEPDYGTAEHRAMIANRRRLERLRGAVLGARRRN